MPTEIKASETRYVAQFDTLISQVSSGIAEAFIEIEWLSEFIFETGVADCELVAYQCEAFTDWLFSDERIRDDPPPKLELITDELRLEVAKSTLETLAEDDTYSLFDPSFFELEVAGSDGISARLVIAAFAEGHSPCFTFMGGYNAGTLIEHVNGLGYLTHEQLQQKDDAWILDRWRRSDD
jgi:hypothetical protein